MKIHVLAATSLLSLITASAHAGDPTSLLLAPVTVAKPETKIAITPPKAIAEPAVAAGAKPSPTPDRIELAALYYYAKVKQENRVQAEYARLQYKYPGFQLPKDLYEPALVPLSEAPLWTLYKKNDFTGIDAELQRRRATRPDWTPSQDFMAKYTRQKMRFSIETASRIRNWRGVIAAGEALRPESEREVDLLWDMMDAYAALGDKQALARYYQAILFRDASASLPKDALIATIKKATRDFSADDVRGVMAQFSGDPVIMAGLTSVSADLVRKEVADFNVDKQATQPLAKADIDTLSAAATTHKAPADFSLLGWYFLKISQPADAGAWFRRAIDVEPSVDHAKGLYLSLTAQQRNDEAYDLALQYHAALAADPVFLMNALAASISSPDVANVKPEAVAAYAAAILATKNGDHSEILAWYAYNSGQFQAARAWFDKAFAWAPTEARLKGLALSEGQLGDRTALVALYKIYADKYPAIWDDVHLSKGGKNRRKVATLDRIQVGAVDAKPAVQPPFLEAEPPQRATAPRRKAVTASKPAPGGGYAGMLASKRYGDCIAALQSQQQQAALSPDASLVKGWCMLGLNRNAEAKDAFTAALAGAGKVQSDAAYGLTLTLLRNKMTNDAQSVIALYPQTGQRDRELKLEIYWQLARASFDHKDYQGALDALNIRIALAPEPTDMTQLRGWAHLKLGHRTEASAIFEGLSNTIDDPNVRRGLAAAHDYGTGSRQ